MSNPIVNKKYMVNHLLDAIRQKSITDIGYCFEDDPYTIQFSVGSAVCRAQLNNKAISVSYGWQTVWLIRETKLMNAIAELIDKTGELERVYVPTSLWQSYSWNKSKDFFWHAAQRPVSLKKALADLFNPQTYGVKAKLLPNVESGLNASVEWIAEAGDYETFHIYNGKRIDATAPIAQAIY